MTLELYLGDCLDVMKDLSGGSVDLFLCDLPYGCLAVQGKTSKMNNNKGEGQNGCAWDIKIDLEKFWEQVKRLRRNDAVPCIMFAILRWGFRL